MWRLELALWWIRRASNATSKASGTVRPLASRVATSSGSRPTLSRSLVGEEAVTFPVILRL